MPKMTKQEAGSAFMRGIIIGLYGALPICGVLAADIAIKLMARDSFLWWLPAYAGAALFWFAFWIHERYTVGGLRRTVPS